MKRRGRWRWLRHILGRNLYGAFLMDAAAARIRRFPASRCPSCTHYAGASYERRNWVLRCAAFPGGIPEAILLGESDHTQKHPDQVGDLLFEMVDPETWGERQKALIENQIREAMPD